LSTAQSTKQFITNSNPQKPNNKVFYPQQLHRVGSGFYKKQRLNKGDKKYKKLKNRMFLNTKKVTEDSKKYKAIYNQLKLPKVKQ
jgi:hypothetical protein